MIGWWIIGLCIAAAGGFYVWKRTQHPDHPLFQHIANRHQSTRTQQQLVQTLLESGIPSQAIYQNLLITLDLHYLKIDTVVVLQSGVMVFEIPKEEGKYAGQGDEPLWSYENHRRTKRIRNPFRALERAIAALRQNLPECTIPCYSVVLVSDKSRIDITHLPEKSYAIRPEQLGEVLNEVLESDPCLTEEQLTQILLVLKLGAYHGKDPNLHARVCEECM